MPRELLPAAHLVAGAIQHEEEVFRVALPNPLARLSQFTRGVLAYRRQHPVARLSERLLDEEQAAPAKRLQEVNRVRHLAHLGDVSRKATACEDGEPRE